MSGYLTGQRIRLEILSGSPLAHHSEGSWAVRVVVSRLSVGR